jgi:hypothetical protein
MTQAQVTGFLESAFNGIGNVNYDGGVHEPDYIATLIGIDRVINQKDILLLRKAYLTTPLDPVGIDWFDWNVDADFFGGDSEVDEQEILIASFFMGKSAG